MAGMGWVRKSAPSHKDSNMGSWLTSEDHVLCKVLDPGGARGAVGRGGRRPLLDDLRMRVE